MGMDGELSPQAMVVRGRLVKHTQRAYGLGLKFR